MIQFNKEALQKQRRQTINNAYSNLSYIIKECKPYLFGLIEGTYPLLRTNTNYRFQTVLTSSEDHLDPFIVTLSLSGKYVLFPTAEFDILDNSVILEQTTELPNDISRSVLVGKVLEQCLADNQEINLLTQKVYCLDYKLYKTVEHVITYALRRMIPTNDCL